MLMKTLKGGLGPLAVHHEWGEKESSKSNFPGIFALLQEARSNASLNGYYITHHPHTHYYKSPRLNLLKMATMTIQCRIGKAVQDGITRERNNVKAKPTTSV